MRKTALQVFKQSILENIEIIILFQDHLMVRVPITDQAPLIPLPITGCSQVWLGSYFRGVMTPGSTFPKKKRSSFSDSNSLKKSYHSPHFLKKKSLLLTIP